MRRALPALLAVLALAGCGGDDPPPPDPPAVRLTIEAPGDTSTVKEDTVEVRGRVQPARAAVEVGGEAAAVSSGAFSKTVKLEQGVNVIDVSARMPGRSSAFAALRVTYDPRVTVPDLSGTVDDEAASRLEDLGLEVRARGGRRAVRRAALGPAARLRVRPAGGLGRRPRQQRHVEDGQELRLGSAVWASRSLTWSSRVAA